MLTNIQEKFSENKQNYYISEKWTIQKWYHRYSKILGGESNEMEILGKELFTTESQLGYS